MAQLSASKTLAQVRPADGVTARLTLTSGVSGRVTRPSRCQLRPPPARPAVGGAEELPPAGLLAPLTVGQAIRARACDGSVAVTDSGLPALSHWTCHVAPAVPVRQISARPPAAAWPSSQPVAGAGKASAVNVGVAPTEIVVAAALAWAAPASGAGTPQSAAASAAVRASAPAGGPDELQGLQ